MKYITIILLVTGAAVLSASCNKINKNSISTENSILPQYDSLKAAELGADEYGMKKYVLAFLKRGPNRSADKEEAMELQKAHLENIRKLAEDGKLVLAGPFMDNGDIRGIYIINVESVAEAKELTNTDPAINAGVLAMELKPWYGSAALMVVNDIHKVIAKKNP